MILKEIKLYGRLVIFCSSDYELKLCFIFFYVWRRDFLIFILFIIQVEIEKLDYYYYFLLFFDGLCEIVYFYEFFVRQGVYDMLEYGGFKILFVIFQLIILIKSK